MCKPLPFITIAHISDESVQTQDSGPIWSDAYGGDKPECVAECSGARD